MVLGDLVILEDLFRSVHLAVLAMCAWLVFSADFTAARSAQRPLTEADFKRLRTYHDLLTKGLIVFWISGIFLIWRGTAFDASQFSPKLIAKIVVVSILTVNAAIIGNLAMPAMERNKGLKFGEMVFDLRLRLAITGGISSASWISAFLLGAHKPLKTASQDELVAFLGPIYAVMIGLGICFAIASAFRKPKIDETMGVMDHRPTSQIAA